MKMDVVQQEKRKKKKARGQMVSKKRRGGRRARMMSCKKINSLWSCIASCCKPGHVAPPSLRFFVGVNDGIVVILQL
jgi:hypothetical protein